MIKKSSKFLTAFLAVIMIFTMVNTREVFAQDTYDLVIMGTSDIHGHALPYDYMNDEVDESLGLSKIYTLVEEIREEYDNTLLFDVGDLIQGSVLADYEKNVEPLQEGDTHSLINVMNHMKYDAAAIGNHELTDYGLEYFHLATSKSEFPWLNANVYDHDNTEAYYFKPYEILEKKIDGNEIKIGVVGFVPPQIMNWGSERLTGKIIAKEIIDEAEKIIPEVAKQSDIVIVLGHTGIDPSGKSSENVGYQLSQMEEIDALLLGHEHGVFPKDFTNIEGVDAEKGLLNDVPTTMMGQWGSNLGRIDLELSYNNGEWEVIDGSSRVIPVNEDVESSPLVEDLMEEKHNKVLNYIRRPIVENDLPINSYFSRVIDSTLNQIINEAQIMYGQNFARNSEEYKEHNVLAAAAPFRAGRGGPSDYTEIDGDITMSDINSIYMYPNTIRIVELTGQQVLDWLEHAAQNFNQIDPNSEEPQNIINDDFAGFYWDVIDGIEYEIDITKPLGERISNPTFQGQALNLEEKFLVVTNDHRAVGGGEFPHLNGATIVYESTTTNQEAIIEYLRESEGMPEIDYNWSIKPFESKGDIIFYSSPKGEQHIEDADITSIQYLETNADGWGVYKLIFEETEPAPVFPDIKDHWAKSYIEAMADVNVIDGYLNGKFIPEGQITRAEFSKMIVKALDLELVEYDNNFKDINKDNWYADYVATLNASGFVKGYPGDIFKPNNKLSRVEMAEMLSNVIDVAVDDEEVDQILGGLKDSKAIPKWALRSVAEVVKAKLMNGHTSDNFSPQGTATRAQAATVIYKLYN